MEQTTFSSEHSVLLGGNGNHACLVRIYPSGTGLGIIDLPLSQFVIGRDAECDLALGDTAVSRKHAVIDFQDGHYWIYDQKSRNGTYVNDRKVESQQLAPGDYVRTGKVITKFLWSDHIETQYHETISLFVGFWVIEPSLPAGRQGGRECPPSSTPLGAIRAKLSVSLPNDSVANPTGRT